VNSKRSTIDLISTYLLFLVVALTVTPAFAATSTEAFSHALFESGQVAFSGPGDPAEMEAFLNDFFLLEHAGLEILSADIYHQNLATEVARE
jgi:hypothetical protein